MSKFIKSLMILCLGVAIGVTYHDEIVLKFINQPQQTEHQSQGGQLAACAEDKDNLQNIDNTDNIKGTSAGL